jgi:hypothetical protein
MSMIIFLILIPSHFVNYIMISALRRICENVKKLYFQAEY